MTVTLITGTSSGIGLELAAQLTDAGHTVIATLRDTARADALRARVPGIDVRRLDVTDATTIEECVASVVRDHGGIDVLVNNAGAGHVGTLENETLDEVRSVFEVNFFGVVALTRAALPHLRASRGRVVTVSSVGGVVGQPFNEAYCGAKFAVEGFMQALAPVAATVGVRVSVVEPAAVRSKFVANAGADLDASLAAAGAYAPALEAYLARTRASFASSTAQTPAEAAAAIAAVVLADEPPVRSQTSEFATAFAGRSLADLDGSTVAALTAGWVTA
jgi:NAD(P)-dependent dehydrogenase (short-subunit alcohol dehydrogenase family)